MFLKETDKKELELAKKLVKKKLQEYGHSNSDEGILHIEAKQYQEKRHEDMDAYDFVAAIKRNDVQVRQKLKEEFERDTDAYNHSFPTWSDMWLDDVYWHTAKVKSQTMFDIDAKWIIDDEDHTGTIHYDTDFNQISDADI